MAKRPVPVLRPGMTDGEWFISVIGIVAVGLAFFAGMWLGELKGSDNLTVCDGIEWDETCMSERDAIALLKMMAKGE